jgi:CheY-like chemotaxis protein
MFFEFGPAEADRRWAPIDHGTGRPTVLVVEDEALLALELEQVLTEAGYAVVLAADGRGALARAAEPGGRLRAAVVDLHLPGGMAGHEVIRHLRGRNPGLPVVVVTGYEPLAGQADLRGLGRPTARLQKPCEPERLLQRLRDVMASSNGAA